MRRADDRPGIEVVQAIPDGAPVRLASSLPVAAGSGTAQCGNWHQKSP
jgi:hypothetical protein